MIAGGGRVSGFAVWVHLWRVVELPIVLVMKDGEDPVNVSEMVSGEAGRVGEGGRLGVRI